MQLFISVLRPLEEAHEARDLIVVVPEDATVGDLSYPEAFPVTYLRPRFAVDAYDRALYAVMAALFRTERFAGLLARTGGIVRQSA